MAQGRKSTRQRERARSRSMPASELGADRAVQLGIRRGDAGHLEFVTRAEERAIGEGLAVGIRHHGAALLQADGGGRRS